MNVYDEDLTAKEIMLMDELKNKSRMEQDRILGEWENGQIH